MLTALLRRTVSILLCSAAGSLALPLSTVSAQAHYPNRPVKVVLPFAAGGGTGGTAVERTFTFRTNGRFIRTGFVGGTFEPLPGDPGASVVTTGSNTNSGTYRVVNGNTMELRFADGTRSRTFFWLPNGPTKSARPGSIRLGGNDYVAK